MNYISAHLNNTTVENSSIGRIIGIDPGNAISGMVVIDNGLISGAFNLENKEALFSKICSYSLSRNVTIVIEDIKPYSVKMSQQVIDTCKFIGLLTYRLEIEAGMAVKMITRAKVKEWIYKSFTAICEPYIDIKIEKKRYAACDVETMAEIRVNSNGSLKKRKGSFVYVDDKMVMEAMKTMYHVKEPPPGKGYDHGLKLHSWQALGAASCYLMTNK